jgi:hypothetical protein
MLTSRLITLLVKVGAGLVFWTRDKEKENSRPLVGYSRLFIFLLSDTKPSLEGIQAL